MIDYDDSGDMWWVHEIEYMVRVMQSSWEEITVESVARNMHDSYGEPGTSPSDELLEMIEECLLRYNDPFDGLGNIDVDLKVLTESGKNALFTAITAKSKLLKAHTAKLDAYVKAKFGNDGISPARQ